MVSIKPTLVRRLNFDQQILNVSVLLSKYNTERHKLQALRLTHTNNATFLYPATQNVAGYYVIPSEPFECLSVRQYVRASVRQCFVSGL